LNIKSFLLILVWDRESSHDRRRPLAVGWVFGHILYDTKGTDLRSLGSGSFSRVGLKFQYTLHMLGIFTLIAIEVVLCVCVCGPAELQECWYAKITSGIAV